jgi:hypothetical protein
MVLSTTCQISSCTSYENNIELNFIQRLKEMSSIFENLLRLATNEYKNTTHTAYRDEISKDDEV